MSRQHHLERQALTVRETAIALGITNGTVYRLARRGTLQTIRLGRAIRVPRTVLRRMLGDPGSTAPR